MRLGLMRLGLMRLLGLASRAEDPGEDGAHGGKGKRAVGVVDRIEEEGEREGGEGDCRVGEEPDTVVTIVGGGDDDRAAERR